MGEADLDDRHDELPSQGAFALAAIGLVAGLVVGLLVAWALGSSGGDAQAPLNTVVPVPEPLDESPEIAADFLVEWERSRRATYLVVTRWHRITDVGGELRQTRVLVQRPPDRVRRVGGAVSGVAGGVQYTCDELPDADVTCQALARPEDGPDFDAGVDQEVALMWSHLEGTQPLYRVSHDGECFHLRLARRMLAPPYGARSTFCFDHDTGAVARFRIERAEGVDTEELVWVTGQVTDADVVAVVDGSFDATRRR